MPETLEYRSDGTRVVSEEALLLFLFRMKDRGGRLCVMEFIFGRDRGTIGKITNVVLAWLYETYAKQKVQEFDHKVFDYYRLYDYRATMKQRGSSIPNVVGFIDGNVHATNALSAAHEGAMNEASRALYSVHKATHGFTFEMLTFPDGMVGRAAGPFPGSEPDHVIASRHSHLALLVDNINDRYNLTMNANQNPYEQDYFTFYADGIYSAVQSDFILTAEKLTRGALHSGTFSWDEINALSHACNSDRTQVENVIGMMYNSFGGLRTRKRPRADSPDIWYIVAVFLRNLRSCIMGTNQVAKKYQIRPPFPEEYLAGCNGHRDVYRVARSIGNGTSCLDYWAAVYAGTGPFAVPNAVPHSEGEDEAKEQGDEGSHLPDADIGGESDWSG